MLNPHKFLVIAITYIPMIGDAQVSMSDGISRKCEQQIFTGFDSRLTVDLLWRLPDSNASVVGFEIVNHRPLVALPHELLGFQKTGISELQVPQTIKGIAVGKESELRVQTFDAVLLPGDDGLKNDSSLTTAVKGRLYNSGAPVYMEARSRKGLVQFVARRLDGSSFVIATFRGQLRTASWNQSGLAAVVDNSLYVWEAGAKSVVRLLSDTGLSAAQDIALVGLGRAVVSLRSSVVLITSETITVLVGIAATHSRFDTDALYLLDGSRKIWIIRGLNKLGTKSGDREHAQELVQKAPNEGSEGSPQFLEAARILGCTTAQKLLAARTSPQEH